MRRLLLLRHAKTERTNPGGDHARRLIERGQQDATRMGAFMQREQIVPQQALVSDAMRTRETLARLNQSFNQPAQATFDPALYLAPPHTILDAIRAAPDDCETLMVIGHNPGIHQFAYDLGQRGPHKLVAALASKFPTCALAVIDCEVESWRDVHSSNCRLARYMIARALRVHEPADLDDDC